jgi:hypothetical protein
MVDLVPTRSVCVAAGVRVAAERADSLDITVRQGTAGGRADRAELHLREDVAVLEQAEEHLLHHGVVVAGGRPGEQVVGQAELLQVLGNHPAVPINRLTRSHSLLVGLHQDRRAVLISAGDHEHAMSGHPLVPAEHIRRHAEARDVPDVPRPVRVRPRHRGQDMISTHGSSLVIVASPVYGCCLLATTAS